MDSFKHKIKKKKAVLGLPFLVMFHVEHMIVIQEGRYDK